jgi:hypothetical protein
MRLSDQLLIQGLQQRNADRNRATGSGVHRRKPFLTATAKEIQVAEQEIGFEFPDLLRTIYSQVANGGFGPEYGIVGIKWGASLDGVTLESGYRKMEKLERRHNVWQWPKRLLPLANYGCGMWSCVDCDLPSLPMILWDPNNLDSNLDGADARLNWGSTFWDQGLSLRGWLEGWLAGRPQSEPKRPSDSWTKKRLGFKLQK